MRINFIAQALAIALVLLLPLQIVRSGSIQPLTSGSGGGGTVNVQNGTGATSSVSALNFSQPLYQTSSGGTSTVGVFEANPVGQQQLAIPMYIDPNVTPAAWTTVTAASPRVGILVANVASGPGAAQDAVYLAAINAAKAAGILVLGYVDTNRGAIPTGTVTNNIDKWYTFYSVDGIFFDQASVNPTDLPYYSNLYSYVRAKSVNHLVVLNPGGDTDEGYAAISDIILNFENTYAAYTSYTPQSWTRKYSPRKFWHCVHTTPAGNAANGILLSKKNRAYWNNFTDDILANPYDTLATYFATEIPQIGLTDGADTRLGPTPTTIGKVIVDTGTGLGETAAAGTNNTVLMGATGATPVFTAATGTGTPVLAAGPTFTGTVNTAALTVATASVLTATNGTFLPADRGQGFVATATAAASIVNTLERVVVSDGTSGTVLSTVSATANPATAGPALNGRDQVGAFSSGVWVYEYAIGGPSLTSGFVLSTSATTPTLTGALAGYKWSKPLTAYFSTTGGAIANTFVHQGQWNHYAPNPGIVVSAGTATTYGAGTSAASLIPPSGSQIMVSGVLTSSTTTGHSTSLSFDGTNTLLVYVNSQVLSIGCRGGYVVMPCINQLVYYFVTGAGDSFNESIDAWAFPSSN